MIQLTDIVAKVGSLIIALSVFVNSSFGQSVDQDALIKAKKMLHKAIEDGEFAGAAYLVWKDGKQLHFEVAGLRDIEANAVQQPDTLMAIASMTKPITAVAAMILYERGKFRLDDPVSKFIPAFEKSEVIIENGEDFKLIPANRQITIRDVLSHSTGIMYGWKVDNYERISKYAAKPRSSTSSLLAVTSSPR